jgi:hypothetical protein
MSFARHGVVQELPRYSPPSTFKPKALVISVRSRKFEAKPSDKEP